MKMNRHKTIWIIMILVLAAVVLPASYSEAQSSEIVFSAQECEKASQMMWQEMDEAQHEFAQECDMLEAGYNWERQYGGLNEQERMAAIVYE